MTISGSISLSDFTKPNLCATSCPQRCCVPPGWLRGRDHSSQQQALLPLGSHSTSGCSLLPFCFADLPATKSPSHTGHSVRACCTSSKSLEKEHPIPCPGMGSRVGSTKALAAAGDVWAGQRRGAGAAGSSEWGWALSLFLQLLLLEPPGHRLLDDLQPLCVQFLHEKQDGIQDIVLSG